MGLEQNTNAVFLSIGDGKITKRVKTPTASSVTRTTKEGKQVHEEIYDAVAGLITDITTKEHPTYGRSWIVTLKDGNESFILQMKYSSGYAAAFLKMLPNVDFTQSVRIIPTMKMEGDKKKVGMFITQNGAALKHYYTRDNQNGLPSMEKIKVKKDGKTTEEWDNNEMMVFLENMVNNEIRPKFLIRLHSVTYDKATGVTTITDANNITEPDEELPF